MLFYTQKHSFYYRQYCQNMQQLFMYNTTKCITTCKVFYTSVSMVWLAVRNMWIHLRWMYSHTCSLCTSYKASTRVSRKKEGTKGVALLLGCEQSLWALPLIAPKPLVRLYCTILEKTYPEKNTEVGTAQSLRCFWLLSLALLPRLPKLSPSCSMWVYI